MKKNVTKTKEYEVEEYFCDLCGNPFSKGICGNSMHVCKVCNRDICSNCAIIDDYFAWADERTVVCKSCNEITKPFKAKLDHVEEIYDIKRKQIWKEFKQAAEENFKKLNVIK